MRTDQARRLDDLDLLKAKKMAMKHSGLFAVLAMAFGANVALAVPPAPEGCPPNDPVCKPCPKGWRWAPKRKTCIKAEPVKP
jgi:hypothetical protein